MKNTAIQRYKAKDLDNVNKNVNENMLKFHGG